MTDMDLFSGDGAASPFDAIRRIDRGRETWSARDLMAELDYAIWRDFTNAVERAKAACRNSGYEPGDHFADARKVIKGGRWGEQEVADYRLTRYACYLIAMNGDPRKDAIARAQTYFAVKTREAEVAIPVQRQLSNRDLALMVIAEADRADAEAAARQVAERRNAELEPVAEAFGTLTEARGDFLVGDAAKTLSNHPAIEIGERRPFARLAEFGWIYRAGDNRWRAYQSAVQAGRLREIVRRYTHPNDPEREIVTVQIRVTVKGLRDLHRRLVPPDDPGLSALPEGRPA